MKSLRQPPGIFISYARANTDVLLPLLADLRNQGYTVWFDQDQMVGGFHWTRAVEQAIELSEIVLVALTPESFHSEHVRDECEFARDCSKRIIPLMFADTHRPLTLSRLSFVDFRPGYARGLQDLLSALRFYAIPLAGPDFIDPQPFPQEGEHQ